MWFFLLFLLLLLVFAPRIMQWYVQYRVRKFQERVMGGMGTRGNRSSGTREDFQEPQHDKIIPRDYGEDVEFTVVQEHTESASETIETDDKGKARVTVEQQVTDAEWIQID